MNMKRYAASLASAVALTAALAVSALAQSADDLKNDEKTPGDVLVYGMGYSAQRFSPLNSDQQGKREQAGPDLGLRDD